MASSGKTVQPKTDIIHFKTRIANQIYRKKMVCFEEPGAFP